MQRGTLWKHGNQWMLSYKLKIIVEGVEKWKTAHEPLAPICDQYRRESDVRPLADEFMKRIPSRKAKGRTMQTLDEFATNEFMPHIEQYRKPSTARTWQSVLYLIKTQIWFSEKLLHEVTPSDITRLLQEIARTKRRDGEVRSRGSIANVRGFLSACFKFAIGQGRLNQNPVREAVNADDLRGLRAVKETKAYTLDEVHAMLKVLPEPARTMVLTAALTGLRIGEIAALKWEDFTGSTLKIQRNISAGVVTTTKTEGSEAEIPLLPILADALKLHKASNGVSEYVFHGLYKADKPIQFGGLTEDVIRPALKKAKIDWQGWHGFRRGVSTTLHELGAQDKLIQAVMRHADVAITMRHYIKARPESVEREMLKLQEAFEKARKSA